MHLIGFNIEIYYDARPCGRQKSLRSVSPLKFANANLYTKMTNLEKKNVCVYIRNSLLSDNIKIKYKEL